MGIPQIVVVVSGHFYCMRENLVMTVIEIVIFVVTNYVLDCYQNRVVFEIRCPIYKYEVYLCTCV